ncbi:CHAT domain-containing protein, partial [Nonomuraea lactucae]|uniref:CHAT domain-containing protein n=1 Tax=Nonomuraea lactucae TaxID=2249762 RepID=UPI0013B4505C
TGRAGDADLAVEAARAATAGVSDEPAFAGVTAAALQTRFALMGNLADLNEAIELCREALDRHTGHSGLLSQLAGSLWDRFRHNRDIGDLDQAIEHGDRAREAIIRGPDGRPADHRAPARHLYNRAGMLWNRFEETGDLDDLDEAIAANRTALDMLPAGHPHRRLIAGGLNILYAARFGHAGAPEDLASALDSGLAALSSTPADDALRPGRLHMIGMAYLGRLAGTRGRHDLNQALAAIRESVETTPDDHPNLCGRLSSLGMALSVKYQLQGRSPDRDEALAAMRRAVNVPTAPTAVRVHAARQYGDFALRTGAASTALDAYRYAIDELLPRLVWRGLDRRSQQSLLKDVAGLAGQAAAAALACDSADEAVRLLEQGRAVLWAQMVETRTERTRLREEHPGLAAEFDEVCEILEASAEPSVGRLEVRRDLADQRRRAATRFDGLRDRIRALPGFAGFLRPVPFSALREAAAEGTIVIVNVDESRCDALLLRSDGLRALPLPGLTREEASARADAFRRAMSRLGEGGGDPGARIAATQTLRATLEWLWQRVAGPVLAGLLQEPAPGERARAGTTGPGSPPRIWWYLTGPLAGMPVHAAGTGERWVGDHVVSSYTTTLQALIRARTSPSGPCRALAVGLRRTPGGFPELPGVPGELETAAELLGATVLGEENATCEAVLRAITGHSWVHLACHGRQDPADPSTSHLALHDGSVTVLDVSRRQTQGAELAFLSACESAQGDLALADEAIHLAAAFQQAGYRHVIGTLWTLQDSTAAGVAGEVYRALCSAGAPDSGRAAYALHEAVRRLRLASPSAPVRWATYLHLGP